MISIILAFSLLAGLPLAKAIDCLSEAELKQKIEGRIATLVQIEKDLNSLVQGKVMASVTLSTLFTVNLNDPESVGRRIDELKGIVSDRAQTKTLGSHPLAECLKNFGDLQSKAKEELDLQTRVNQLRLEFLSLEPERRRALLDLQQQATQQSDQVESFEKAQIEAEQRSSSADEALKEAEAESQKARGAEARKIAALRALLEKTRKEIADLHALWAERLKKEAESAQIYTKSLSQGAAPLSQKDSPTKQLETSYAEVTSIWRTLLDQLFAEFGSQGFRAQSIPELPDTPDFSIAELSGEVQEAVLAYKETYIKGENELKNLIDLRDQLTRDFEGTTYKLILLAGSIRSQFIVELVLRKDSHPLNITNDFLKDVFREIRLIPYRPLVLFKTQIIQTRETLSEGISGVLTVLKRLLILLLFVATPIVSYRIMQRGALRLNQFRQWLMANRGRSRFRAKLALWIQRLNPYFTWAMMFVATRLAGQVIADTELEALREILPYFEYYFLYKIFRIALSQTAIFLAEYSLEHATSSGLSARIEKTGRFLGLYFLTAAYVLEATEAATRKALFYHLTQDTLLWLTPLAFAWATYWWRLEIGAAIERAIPGPWGLRIRNATIGQWSFILCVPALLLLALTLAFYRAQKATSQLDSAKKVSAQLFRRRLESAAEESAKIQKQESLDTDYLALFSLGVPEERDLFIRPESVPIDSVLKIIETWSKAESDEHTVAIQGEKGSGKSCLLEQVALHAKNLKIISLRVQDKVTTPAQFWQFLAKGFNFDPSLEAKGILEYDKLQNKTLVLIDEAQNLFLGRRGGFEAFKLLSSVINLRTENIFWCFSFNKYSWVYLNAVMRGSQFFRRVHSIGRWSDDDIKSLILKRHEKSGFKLEYDPVIFALDSKTGADGVGYIQDRFFEMLWEQSKGNPRTAITLWLSALGHARQGVMRVSIPMRLPSEALGGLTDEELFVIAAVIRHENLTVDEAISVTSLDAITVRHALKVGSERQFLDRSTDGRYRVDPVWQATLSNEMISKNFVYE